MEKPFWKIPLIKLRLFWASADILPVCRIECMAAAYKTQGNKEDQQKMNSPADEAYPPAETGERDPCCAALLYNDYAGSVSEFSAIARYLYQHFITAAKHPELSEELRRIAMDEMRHLELIGELIVSFGGDPKLRCLERCSERFWSGSFVNYGRDPRYFLTDDIKNEQKAVAAYRLRLCQLKNAPAKTLIERIIQDELRHIEALRSRLAQLDDQQ